jgi:hypothetical protein
MSRALIHLHFAGLDRDLAGATAIVRLVNDAEADAPAAQLGMWRLPVQVRRDQPEATLEIDLPETSSPAAPGIQVHVDTDGAGAIKPGHYLNATRAELPRGPDRVVRIELTRVN